MVIVGFVLVLGFGAVITNLVRLQLVNGETLKTDAVDQSLQSTQLTPSRGTIYDATGTKVLAQSASVWTVALEPNYIDEGDGPKPFKPEEKPAKPAVEKPAKPATPRAR